MAKKASAKKVKKKATKKASKKTAKKSTKKSASKKTTKKTTKKAAKKKTTKKTGPRKVSTGKGLSPAELGQILVDHVNSGGDDRELWRAHFSTKCVSIEGSGEVYDGRKAMNDKYEWFFNNFEVHSCKADGLFVGATGFSVHFVVDMTEKATGERHASPEIGVYTVKNGKIVHEEFMYAPMPPAS